MASPGEVLTTPLLFHQLKPEASACQGQPVHPVTTTMAWSKQRTLKRVVKTKANNKVFGPFTPPKGRSSSRPWTKSMHIQKTYTGGKLRKAVPLRRPVNPARAMAGAEWVPPAMALSSSFTPLMAKMMSCSCKPGPLWLVNAQRETTKIMHNNVHMESADVH